MKLIKYPYRAYILIDDKRYVLDDGLNTLAYFHKDCKKCDKSKNNNHNNNDNHNNYQ